jgi:hypothetical protein
MSILAAVRRTLAAPSTARVSPHVFFSSRVLADLTRRQAFSTTRTSRADVAKLILVGRLGRDPEVKTTKNDKEYVAYVFSLFRARTCPLTLARAPQLHRCHD